MQTLTVISGKGGTGKTSLLASFVALAGRSVIADCDVDAADLHLVLNPETQSEEAFFSSRIAVVDSHLCIGCGQCRDLCRFEAVEIVEKTGDRSAVIHGRDCEGCGVCERFCAAGAIHMEPRRTGLVLQSDTRFGPLVHAQLDAGGENSGKLVTEVRRRAKQLAKEKQLELVLVDGSPGVGCPVMASLTASDLALIVSESSISALHDMERVIQLLRQLRIPAMVCVNRHDQNHEVAQRILSLVRESDLELAGMVRLDPNVTQAQRQGVSVVEFCSTGAALDIAQVWERVLEKLISLKTNTRKS